MAAPLISKRHIGLFIVLALAALTWWWQQKQIEEAPGAAVGEVKVDYSLERFSITAMDDNGRPKHRLDAESLVHFAESDYAEIERPHLELYGEAGKTVRLNADMALVYQGGDPVLLRGDVQIIQYDEQDRQMLEVLTSDVWFYAEREVAETAEAVVLKDGIGVTEAQGMRIELEAGRLYLLAAVRGRYVVE